MMKRRCLISLVVLLSLLCGVGCKSTQRAVVHYSPQEQYFVDGVLAHYAESYHTFTSKLTAKVAVQGGQSFSSRATLTIVKDSLLQISVQPFLGIEMFRLQATADSVVVIDRTQRRYLAEPLSALPAGLSLTTLQDLFLGRPFVMGSQQFTAKEMDSCTLQPNDLGGYDISCDTEPEVLLQFILNRAFEVVETRVQPTSFNSLSHWNYSQYIESGRERLPQKVEVRNLFEGQQVDLTLQYSSPVWNKSVKPTTTIPSSYKRVGMNELKEMLKL